MTTTPRGAGSTTSRSSPTTWTPPSASTRGPRRPLVATIGTPDFRHYFFEFGAGVARSRSSSTATAARDLRQAGRRPRPARLAVRPPVAQPARRGRAPRAARAAARAGCEVTDVVDHGIIHSVYFTDPNGIALEASWWVRDVTAGSPDYDGPDFGDPNPVPALEELRATGALTGTPRTQLT